MQAAAAAIVNAAPSLVLLQEIWTQADAELLTAALAPHGFHVSSTPTRWGFRKGGLLTFAQSWGPAPTDAWSVISQAFTPFSTSAPAWRVWEADGLMSKGRLEMTIACGTRARITVVNTHLQAEYSDDIPRKRYSSVRITQLREVIGAVARVPPEHHVLVAGDFNTTPEETAIFPAIAAAGWTELTAGLRAQHEGGTHIPKQGERPEWLDYVFARPQSGTAMTATASFILNTARDLPYSDHHGLIVDISVA